MSADEAAFQEAVGAYGHMAHESKGDGFDDPAVEAAAVAVFVAHNAVVAFWRQRAERAESLLAARTAAEYPAAFAADNAARAVLAADRAAIPPTERDRREKSGESDPWAPWREGDVR